MEQAKASTATQEIIDKIQTMSTHQLGTETMTKINLIIHGNVGTKAPGQACVFDFEQSDTDSNKHSGSKTNQTIRQGSTKTNGATSIKTVKNSTKEAISTQQKKTTGKTTTVSENYDENMNEEDDQ
ncbi:unnamed protein product [Rotaria sp. Silwood1]|nr:unnamed protein product [Rotaria sp. Silwood1]